MSERDHHPFLFIISFNVKYTWMNISPFTHSLNYLKKFISVYSLLYAREIKCILRYIQILRNIGKILVLVVNYPFEHTNAIKQLSQLQFASWGPNLRVRLKSVHHYKTEAFERSSMHNVFKWSLRVITPFILMKSLYSKQ